MWPIKIYAFLFQAVTLLKLLFGKNQTFSGCTVYKFVAKSRYQGRYSLTSYAAFRKKDQKYLQKPFRGMQNQTNKVFINGYMYALYVFITEWGQA